MKVRYLIGIFLVSAMAGLQGLALADESRFAEAETEYLAVFMEGKKVGHAIRTRVVADGKVTTTERINITISRGNIPVTMDMAETSIETVEGRPLAFDVVQKLSGLAMKVAGTVNKQGIVNLTTTSMGVEQKSTLEWPRGAVMAEGLHLLTLKKGLKEGTSYTAKIFSPGIMQALDTQIRIGPRRNVDLLGRVVPLTEVTSTYVMPGAGQIVSTSYVDDESGTQKSIIPLAGMQIEMVACAKAFALSDNDVFEIIDKLFVASPTPLGDFRSVKSIGYLLSPTGGSDGLMIPANDNQRVRKLENGKVIVVVEPVAAPAGARFPYKGKDEKILEALKPNRFLQSDRKEIIDLARRAIGRTKDAAEAARKIEQFVGDYIEDKSLSVGYASATEVAASRQGDCSEHSVLAAAMCRAVGIPAQVATGLAYVEEFAGQKNGFGGHAWVQVYIGGGPASREPGKWVGLDPAFRGTGRGGYGPGHIALAVGNGNLEDFFNLVTTVGQFKIEKVIINNK
jgi:hypothetical protein